MQHHWAVEELIDHWMLFPAEQEALGTSRDTNRLGLAVMLKAFQQERRFPYNTSDVPSVVVDYVSRQLNGEFREPDVLALIGREDQRGEKG